MQLAKYICGKDDFQIRRSRLPDYMRMDVTVSYKWTWNQVNWSGALSIFILWDRSNVKYQQSTFSYQPPGEEIQTVGLSTIQPMLGRIPNLSLRVEF